MTGRRILASRGDVVRRPRRYLKGDPLPGANRLNEIIDPLQRLGRSPAGGQVLQTPALYLQVFQLQINFILTDYLQGREYVRYDDGTERIGPVDITVALPWLLRQTPFNGQTYNGVTYTYTGLHVRTATAGQDSETQRVTPDYVLGDIIYCARQVQGGSGVALSMPSLDLNVDGRCWAADLPTS